MLALLELPLRSGIVLARPDPGRFGFGHALVRDTLLESLGATRRARLHLVVAEALEEAYGDDLEPHLAEIAHHFLQSATEGGAERAVDYAARAAQRAVVQFAYEEAARLYERAIDVAASLPADEPRAWQLAQGLGEARMRAGDVDGALRALRAAAEHARRLDDPERLAQTALASTLGAFSPGLVEPELVATLEEALARLDALTRRRSRCRARRSTRCAAACACSSRSRCTGRRSASAASGSSTRRSGWRARSTAATAARSSPAHRVLADRTLAFALAQGFVAVWGPDTVTRGLPISLEALELCERTQRRRARDAGAAVAHQPAARARRPACAPTRRSRPSASTARRLGQPRMLVYDPLHRAMAAHLRGDFAAAERFTAEAVEQSRDVPGSIAPIIADAQTFFAQRMQGRHRDLEPLVRRNADRLPAMRRWRCGLALVLAELGREDEARRELEHLAAADFEDVPRDALWLVSMSLLAELCALLDDRPRARRLYELLIAYEGRNVVSMGAVYLGPVARYLGLLAMTIGEDERALGHLETARSAAERMGARPTVVLAALDAAEVLARRAAPGDAQRGRALVQRVAEEAAQMGMDARGRARRRPARAPGGVRPAGAPACRRAAAARGAAPRAGRLAARVRRAQRLPARRQGPAPPRDAVRAARGRRSPRSRSRARRAAGASATRPRSSPIARRRRTCATSWPRRRRSTIPSASSRARERLELIAADVEQADEATSADERARADQRHARDQGGGPPDRRAGARARPPAARHGAHRDGVPLRARSGHSADVGGRALDVERAPACPRTRSRTVGWQPAWGRPAATRG